MVVDHYTKAVLTMIAACLVTNLVRELPFVKQSNAAQAGGAVHVIIDQAEPYSLQNAGPIEVKRFRD